MFVTVMGDTMDKKFKNRMNLVLKIKRERFCPPISGFNDNGSRLETCNDNGGICKIQDPLFFL